MLRTWSVGKWLCANRNSARCVASLAVPTESQPVYKPVQFLTDETNPVKHGDNHLGMFYRMPDQDFERLFSVYQMCMPRYLEQSKALGGTFVMVRRPAVEIIQRLEKTDLSRPAIRYMLYGRYGAGKKLTMTHVLHYAYTSNWVVVNVPHPRHWFKYRMEFNPSASDETLLDIPFIGAKLLAHFKSQNLSHFSTLRTTKPHEITKRQVIPEGAPLMELVDLGIQRVKHSNVVVNTLLGELKTLATKGECKVMVLIGGVNFFFQGTNHRKPDRSLYDVWDFSLARSLFSMVQSDWNGGAIVSSLCVSSNSLNHRESHYPRYLLGRDGFEKLDPFLPVRVDNYSEQEFESCMDFYINKKWLVKPAAKTPIGRKELAFVSAYNPLALNEISEGI
ncbi:unnamed protein product [Notodromas monacha]|uniref:Small ribosomal subunit protein mS29 n=1 Tax=Notodromas monacha TaxID=399045 RepID=A0A7R9BE51_9CRUS|nr:unnamed protein product [Notodromas monacha]CAG0912794.1 unnamed protein product [Notodromas monacha]